MSVAAPDPASGLAAALEVVGARWALRIVGLLLDGPRGGALRPAIEALQHWGADAP